MTARRVLRLAALAALAALVAVAPSGCAVIAGIAATGAVLGGATGAVVAGPPRPASITLVGAAVTVSLEPARDLAITGGAAGDTAWVRRVVAIVGRVTAQRGDTLDVSLTEVDGSRGKASFPAIAGPVASVVRQPGVVVRVLTRHARRSDAILLGAAIGAAAAILSAWYICYYTCRFD